MRNEATRRAEIARRYDKDKGERPRVSQAVLRCAQLRRLFQARYGHVLPDEDAGREDAFVMINHLAKRPDAQRLVPAFLSLWCPWMTTDEIGAMTTKVIAKPLRWKADTLAARLNLEHAERQRHRITTIGATDLTKEQREARRRSRKQQRKKLKRRAQGVKPRAEYEANSLSRTKPWEAEGISRSTWGRRRRRAKPVQGEQS
jgi:hypothetical protein